MVRPPRLCRSTIRSLKQYADINHPLWFLLPLYSQILASETISRAQISFLSIELETMEPKTTKKRQIRNCFLSSLDIPAAVSWETLFSKLDSEFDISVTSARDLREAVEPAEVKL